MPTVTVLAWCLIASTGRVSSSIACVSAAVRSSTTVLGVPTLPCSTWYTSSGHDAGGVAEQRREPHAVLGLEVAVVAPGAQPVEEPRAPARSIARGEAREQVVDGAGGAGLDRGAGLAQRPRRGVDRERGLVAEQVAGHRRRARTRARGAPPGPRSSRTRRRSGPARLGRDHDRRGRGARGRSRPPWRRRRRSNPASPAAHTRISGSDDRSMCFLSSVTSHEIDL